MEKIISVVGAILIEDGKILIAQRGPGRALANLWEFPGGKIEKHETAREALVRELNEELNITVQVEEDLFDHTRYVYDFGIVELTTYRCQLVKGIPRLTEHVAIKWVEPHELDPDVFAPADIPAVEKLKVQGV
ncbi:(deoxy)nucleoside triphosphate pyrophosphohydrolase [Enterococcus bulliens]